MQLFLIILAVLFVLYIVGRLRSAFSVDQDAIKERLGSDATHVRNTSGRVAYGVTAASTSRLSRLQARLENYAAQNEQPASDQVIDLNSKN